MEQSPEGETFAAGIGDFGHREETLVNDKRAWPVGKVGTAEQWGKPLR